MTSSTSASTTRHEGTAFRLAFEKNLGAMAALREDELRRVNVNIPTLVPRMLGAMGNLKGLRPEIVSALPRHALGSVDALEGLTLALAHAQALAMAANRYAEAELAALAEEGRTLRESLVADAHGLARHKLLDEKSLEAFKNQAGYRVVAGCGSSASRMRAGKFQAG